jgi:uncharacterized damage-inducible protein DinB
MGAASPVLGDNVDRPSITFEPLVKAYEDEMMGVAKAMPADKYNFAPSQAIFSPAQKTNYVGVMTFGQMIAHVAQANYYYFDSAGGRDSLVDVKAIAKLTSKDDLVKALQDSFVAAHKGVANLTGENSLSRLPGGVDKTRISTASQGIAHGYDHYGQLVEYLRMNGIVPPASVK